MGMNRDNLPSSDEFLPKSLFAPTRYQPLYHHGAVPFAPESMTIR